MEIEELGPDDLLSLWVGRVARAQALLEYGVSNVFVALLPPGSPDRARRPPGFRQLTHECLTRLAAAKLPEDVTKAGKLALLAARAANQERNQVLHDIWLPGSHPDADTEWITFARLSGDRPYAEPASRQLADVRSTHVLLERARVRVSGLFMALHASLPWLVDDRVAPSRQQELLHRHLAMMTDRFEVEPNGDVSVR